jgi:hypothetical protein
MGYLKIPRFQRPYSWERNEVEDFWTDTIVDSETDYFIGSIVLFRYSKNLFGLVDGQQRLTTVTMLLCCLRNLLKSQGYAELARGLHQLVERPDINNKNQFVLQTETSYPFLQEHIQRFDGSNQKLTGSHEEGLLKASYDFITEKLGTAIESVQQDTTLSPDKKKEIIKQKLVEIRDRLLRLKLIVIILENEEDAYTIFETLNTRGKDLTVSDLVRTHLTRLLPQTNQNVDRPKERFNKIIEGFESSEADISINSFLHHYWLSRYDYTTEKKLYKEIRKSLHSKADATKYLDSLEADSSLYRVVHEPTSRKWRIEQEDIRDSLNALNLFRVRQQMPFVLSVLGEWEDRSISLKLARRALRAVENFHFGFTAVTSQRSSGGISFMYALHARQLRNAKGSVNKAKAIGELIQKLRDRRPVYQEFEANFRDILYSEKFTNRKALVQYILAGITKYSVSTAIAWDRMTIEHLANQSFKPGGSLSDEDVARIGNLLLVSDPMNAKLKSKSFEDKMKILRGSREFLDSYLKQQTHWGKKQIEERTDFLAKLAYEKVWRI